MVHVRKRRLHAAGERLVARVRLQRVEPDQRVSATGETRHLRAELLGVATVPAVREQYHDRAATEAPAVLAVERGERVADARPARPVAGSARSTVERAIGVAAGQ